MFLCDSPRKTAIVIVVLIIVLDEKEKVMPRRHGSKKDRDKLSIVFRKDSDLKSQLASLSIKNNRTMNGQVLEILENHFKKEVSV